MFITEEDSQNRIQRSAHLTNGSPNLRCAQIEDTMGPIPDESTPVSTLTVEEHQYRGRTKGTANIADFMRPIIGASVHLSGRKETVEAFGISSATASTLAHGKTTYCDTTRENKELKSKVDSILDKVQETAADRLLNALGMITPDKMENAKLRDLSSIAADMSRIIEKTTPKQAQSAAGVQVIIHTPRQINEDQYEVITISGQPVTDSN